MMADNLSTPRQLASQSLKMGQKEELVAKYDEAAGFYYTATQQDQTWDWPRIKLAQVLLKLEDIRSAASVAFSCLKLRPVESHTIQLISHILGHYSIDDVQGIEDEDFLTAFEVEKVRIQEICGLALKVLKARAPFVDLLQFGEAEGWVAAATQALNSTPSSIAQDRLLIRLLSRSFNIDRQLENLLVQVRRQLLLQFSEDEVRFETDVEFLCALARQCVLNEFAWFADEDELGLLETIRKDLAARLATSGTHENCYRLILCMMYHPVHELLDPLPRPDDLDHLQSEPVRQWIVEHLTDYTDEISRRSKFVSVTDITNSVSTQVADMYEVHPYPRWTDVDVLVDGILLRRLGERIQKAGKSAVPEKPEILIAGCGTGVQAVQSAGGYGSEANLTAVDLSRSSLAYAQKMTDRYGYGNINFYRADITELGNWGRQFDIVLCTGVLHHMEDPMKGWRALRQLIKPSGYMKIALYSDYVKNATHQELDKFDTSPDLPIADRIRLYRRNILNSKGEELDMLSWLSEDFYTMSGCRDYLFHIRAHQYTLEDISHHLGELDLEFMGFDLSQAQLSSFRSENSASAAEFQLESWLNYERRHPELFSRMYNFWCHPPQQ